MGVQRYAPSGGMAGCGEGGTALQAEKKHSMEVAVPDKSPVAESVCTFHC